jgi:hypothetical protein
MSFKSIICGFIRLSRLDFQLLQMQFYCGADNHIQQMYKLFLYCFQYSPHGKQFHARAAYLNSIAEQLE